MDNELGVCFAPLAPEVGKLLTMALAQMIRFEARILL